jgi:hypothetical protein
MGTITRVDRELLLPEVNSTLSELEQAVYHLRSIQTVTLALLEAVEMTVSLTASKAVLAKRITSEASTKVSELSLARIFGLLGLMMRWA